MGRVSVPGGRMSILPPVAVDDALVAELRRATRVVLPRAGHNVHVSRSDHVVDIVEQAISLADATTASPQ